MAASILTMHEGTPPATPSTGRIRVYAKTDKKLYMKDDAGTETVLTNPGVQTVLDTDSVDLTLSGTQLSADIRLSGGTLATDASGVKVAAGGITNTQISNTAAIAYSKLNLAGSLVNADVASGAAIAYSKLNLSSSVVNADIAVGAAIAYAKLNLSSSIVDSDVSNSAAISIAKLGVVSTPSEQYGKPTSGDTLSQAIGKLTYTQLLQQDSVSADITIPTGHTLVRSDMLLTGTNTLTIPSGATLRLL